MKVIITGATGKAGREIVKKCIEDPRITKIIILTRRAVAGGVECNPKTEVVMHQDFTRYSDDLLRRLEGAEACFWAIGARAEEVDHDKIMAHQINVEYPAAAAHIFSERIANKAPPGKKFNFIFCSDKHAERNQSRSRLLLSLGDARRNKGEAEKALCEVANASQGSSFVLWILRPSVFAAADAPKKRRLVGGMHSSIDPTQLANAAVRVACEGWKDRVIENDALLKM